MLNTERNTPAMGKRVLKAFRAWHRANRKAPHTNLDCFYEHGQWFACDLDTGAQWSVCDTGSPEYDGFCFEQVTMGEDE